MQVAVKAKEVGGVTIVESATSTGISDHKQAPVPVSQPESTFSNQQESTQKVSPQKEVPEPQKATNLFDQLQSINTSE